MSSGSNPFPSTASDTPVAVVGGSGETTGGARNLADMQAHTRTPEEPSPPGEVSVLPSPPGEVTFSQFNLALDDSLGHLRAMRDRNAPNIYRFTTVESITTSYELVDGVIPKSITSLDKNHMLPSYEPMLGDPSVFNQSTLGCFGRGPEALSDYNFDDSAILRLFGPVDDGGEGVPPGSTHRRELVHRDLEVLVSDDDHNRKESVSSSAWDLLDLHDDIVPGLPRNGSWANGVQIATISDRAKDTILHITHAEDGSQLLGLHKFVAGIQDESLIGNAKYFANKNLTDPKLHAIWEEAVSFNESDELTFALCSVLEDLLYKQMWKTAGLVLRAAKSNIKSSETIDPVNGGPVLVEGAENSMFPYISHYISIVDNEYAIASIDNYAKVIHETLFAVIPVLDEKVKNCPSWLAHADQLDGLVVATETRAIPAPQSTFAAAS